MDLGRYLRVLAGRWRLVAVVLILAIGVSAAAVELSPASAQSSLELLVVPISAGQGIDKAYSGELLAQQEAHAYARLLTSDVVVHRAAGAAHLSDSQVRDALVVTQPPATALIQVHAHGSSAARALRIAQALGVVLPAYAASLRAQDSATRVVIAQPATQPTLSKPSRALGYLLGLVIGSVLAMIAASAREATDRRVRVVSDVLDVVASPIVVRVPVSRRRVRAAALEAGGLLAVQLRRTASVGQVLLVAGTSSKLRKQTLGSALGSALKHGGARVLIVDACPDVRAQGRAASVSEGVDLAELDIRSHRLEHLVELGPLGLDHVGLASMRALRRSIEASSSPGSALGWLLDRVVASYDHVIVHGADLRIDSDMAAAMQSQAGTAVLVASAGKTRSEELADAASLMWLLKLPVAAVVLAGAPGRTVGVEVEAHEQPAQFPSELEPRSVKRTK